jgi:purine-nucleoside/S-methyl-5'-thioadenosine phosphorylase / adenosine deaminase
VPAKKLTASKKSLPKLLRAKSLARLPWLAHGFSTRAAGDLGSANERGRAAFLRAIAGKNLVTLKQVHSDVTHELSHAPEAPLSGDGMLTATPGLTLAIQTADCLPVLVVDTKHKAVAAFHAGWRGTLARIVEKGIGRMRQRFHSQPADLLAVIGPGIHRCCYEVGAELRPQFEAQFDYAPDLFEEVFDSNSVHQKYPLLFLTARAPGHSDLGPKLHLDLVEANRRQLLAAGLKPQQIEVLDLCTSCRKDLLFSYRAEMGKTGRMLGAIGIR